MLWELLKATLITSLAGSSLTLVITLLKPVTKRLFSYAWHYYIWLSVLIVMVLPVRFAIPNTEFFKYKLTHNEEIQQVVSDNFTDAPINQKSPSAPLSPSAEREKPPTQFFIDRTNLLGVLWLAGTLTALSVNIVGYLRLIYRIDKQSVIIHCPEIEKYTDRKIAVRISKNLSSPFIMGIFKPTLILPDTELTPLQLNNILSHEMTHFKRKDIVYKWFLALVKALHWFNPLIYYAAVQIHTECEISCDLSVVKNMDNEQRLAYINTIIALLTSDKSKNIPLTTGMTGGKKYLIRRFTMIKNAKNKGRIISAVSALIAIIMLSATVLASGILSDALTEDYRIEILLDNAEVLPLKNKPFIANGEVYIPLRETFEQLGIMGSPESAIVWNNGRINITVAESVSPADNSTGVSVILYDYAVEIGKSEIVFNAHPTSLGQDVSSKRSMQNAPVLKNNNTYVPLSYLRRKNIDLFQPLRCKIYDKSGSLLDALSEPAEMIINPLPDGEKISRDFETRVHPITGEIKVHNGIDISAGEGTPILSAINGRVTETGFDNERGKYIVISNNIVTTAYLHLSEITVTPNSIVKQAQEIGKVGKTGSATGPFLHFEIKIGDSYINPTDFIAFQNDTASVIIDSSSGEVLYLYSQPVLSE